MIHDPISKCQYIIKEKVRVFLIEPVHLFIHTLDEEEGVF